MIKAPKELISENHIYLYYHKQNHKKWGDKVNKTHAIKVSNYFILI